MLVQLLSLGFTHLGPSLPSPS
uniref:Uncharacterized protein n=1 Tax=Arundo donax TaxID=35708 RepID=A0A0A9BFV0_ARUDO